MEHIFTQDMLKGLSYIAIYFVICASAALTCRLLIKIPNELFRKILHFILLGSLIVFVYGFSQWKTAAAAAVIFAAVVWPILFVCEGIRGFSELTTERKHGELKKSLLLVFSMFALIITVCWGWLGDRMLVLVCVYAWGFGDAAAALVGKKWGKHKVHWKRVHDTKSWEGSAAMFLCSLICVTVLLGIRGGLHPAGYVVIPAVTALVSAFIELITLDGMDTVNCPLAAMSVVLPLVELFKKVG